MKFKQSANHTGHMTFAVLKTPLEKDGTSPSETGGFNCAFKPTTERTFQMKYTIVPTMIPPAPKKYSADEIFTAELPEKAAFVIILNTAAITPQHPFPDETYAECAGENCAQLLKLPDISPAPEIPQAPAQIRVPQYDAFWLISIKKKIGRTQSTAKLRKSSINRKT
jgi:hypothetical protein